MNKKSLINIMLGDKKTYQEIFSHYSLLITVLVTLNIPEEKQNSTIKAVLYYFYEYIREDSIKIIDQQDIITFLLQTTKIKVCQYYTVNGEPATEKHCWAELLNSIEDRKLSNEMSPLEFVTYILRKHYNLSKHEVKNVLEELRLKKSMYNFQTFKHR